MYVNEGERLTLRNWLILLLSGLALVPPLVTRYGHLGGDGLGQGQLAAKVGLWSWQLKATC